MLTLTENASAVVKQLADQTGGEGSGLRISQDSPGAEALDVAPAAEPDPGDQVVESAGARVFLEEHAAETLDDKVLDAMVDSQGGVQFTLEVQPTA